jgi:hypothetical protein
MTRAIAALIQMNTSIRQQISTVLAPQRPCFPQHHLNFLLSELSHFAIDNRQEFSRPSLDVTVYLSLHHLPHVFGQTYPRLDATAGPSRAI